LGVINTWIGLDKSRVKLKVSPAPTIPVGGADPRLQFCPDNREFELIRGNDR